MACLELVGLDIVVLHLLRESGGIGIRATLRW